jgi:peptidoglycan hydrolase-like protein with peptidoglycan-binding domain
LFMISRGVPMAMIQSLQNYVLAFSNQSLKHRSVSRLVVSSWVAGVAIALTGSNGMAASVSSSTELTPHPSEPMLVSQLPTPIILRREDSGNAVSALQRRLTELGFYNGPVTGFFGELTESAVRNFQASQGLTADGIVGASTTEALRRAPSSTSTAASASGALTIGATGNEVNQVQTRLTQLGFYTGPVTGFYGELTAEAVRQFQAANGLTVDGVVGSATSAALQGSGQAQTMNGPDPNDGLLERGETGSAVSALQQRLRNVGYYNGPIDGDFGSLTFDAVVRFQRAQGLVADGVVGPATLAALTRVESGASPVSNRSVGSSTQSAVQPATQSTAISQRPVTAVPPSVQASAFPTIASNPFPSTGGTAIPSGLETASPEAVMALQRSLQNQGFYNGPIDGVMSYETQQAIAAARNAYGISSEDFDTSNPF